jgi:CheY-like chemotaxis protein
MSDRHPMRVLIAEDEFLLADDIASWLERAGATVVGPLPSVERTLARLKGAPEIDVAVLDINLNGELIYPVADELARRDVPVVFYTGYDLEVPERFSSAMKISKSASSGDLVNAVFEQRLRSLATLPPMRREGLEECVLQLVPALRLRARLLLPSPRAADALVERTLERAICEVSTRVEGQDLDTWLHQIMLAVFAQSPFGPN